ncbi:hypothetical protein FACS189421_06140 [Bacteroidia bacterium]|nr:hypothetical protein FACS189421_06140 [Bacteroidia bacterium]GHT03381.1 hypothetical protein FACS189423_04150 [Bacteroidia bacterium]GHT45169.1 hypothetical protein FACS189440_00640 [Bacteroidia bacterium]
MEILKNIEAIRKEKGVKQAVIGEILGIGQSAYSNYITRSHDIYYGRLSQIANALGVSVVDIVTYPAKYVPANEDCSQCREKNEIIKNLNSYIKLLTKE